MLSLRSATLCAVLILLAVVTPARGQTLSQQELYRQYQQLQQAGYGAGPVPPGPGPMVTWIHVPDNPIIIGCEVYMGAVNRYYNQTISDAQRFVAFDNADDQYVYWRNRQWLLFIPWAVVTGIHVVNVISWRPLKAFTIISEIIVAFIFGVVELFYVFFKHPTPHFANTMALNYNALVWMTLGFFFICMSVSASAFNGTFENHRQVNALNTLNLVAIGILLLTLPGSSALCRLPHFRGSAVRPGWLLQRRYATPIGAARILGVGVAHGTHAHSRTACTSGRFARRT